MKHILVPIGSSENAVSTLQYAIDFAAEFNADVFVFRAYNVQTKAGTIINVDSIIERETNLYLRTIVKSVDTKKVAVKLIAAKGSVIDSINAVHKELTIDLIVTGPKSNSIKEEVFLGNTSGSIVKQTEIPVLVVPHGFTFSPVKRVLTAFKSGIINKSKVLSPLKDIKDTFKADVNLLLVKTPSYTEEDLEINENLKSLENKLTVSENATTFQGVLEHFRSNNPDMLCVFRRKRGFFKKLWEKNTILKSEFYCTIPLLVLSGQE
ncbi:nucleotide-binding universal stress UspA family protein [Lutibacter sp. Hel_I_33_5]|uniref:universal stress protein n=1 Tax=Lutibacter sp. Hel_I_33_5 TaxID=1566289 RepID=UPI0011A0DCC7|nr:universal stress protein [Lutibacter sp. Hel_I_33_5]TVZ56477.1 nucleotide-binding universal stress UspA family protein [Lutibacter sp. Hel_I_33_5]